MELILIHINLRKGQKANNETTTKINTSGLAKGVYIIDVKSRVSSVKKKVIIE